MRQVVFRRYPDGSIIALFPFEPSEPTGKFCLCYEHMGQHGSADYEGVLLDTEAVRPNDVSALVEELDHIGYKYFKAHYDPIDAQKAQTVREEILKAAYENVKRSPHD